MIKIANDIPSGYAPHKRMMIVKAPMPMANTILPFIVIGDVAMSVAMKKAPSIKPPPKIWTIGCTNCTGLISQHVVAMRATVAMMMTGVCQSMTFLNIRNRPPMMMAMDPISPSEPL